MRIQNKALYVCCGFPLLNPSPLFPSDSSDSFWLPRAKSSQVLKRVGAQPRSCGMWWCRSAACPSSTRGTTTAEWASLNTESPPWASCTGTLQTLRISCCVRLYKNTQVEQSCSFWYVFHCLTHSGANSSLSSRNLE